MPVDPPERFTTQFERDEDHILMPITRGVDDGRLTK